MERAEAEKVQVVKGAEADAEAKFLQGQVGLWGSRIIYIFGNVLSAF